MGGAGGRFLALFLVVVALGVAVVVLGPKLLGMAAGPESEVITRLKQTERSGLSLAIRGTGEPLRSTRHRYERFSVLFDPDARAVFVAATLDFDGRLGAIRVGSLGVEKVVFRYDDGDWLAPEGLAPTLVAVVSALEARRQALQTMDEEALRRLLPPAERAGAALDSEPLRALRRLTDRSYVVTAWYIRLDRDRAEVTEDHRLTGTLPERPIDTPGTRRLSLRKEGTEFYFWPGLM